jgi:hypothetical protein
MEARILFVPLLIAMLGSSCERPDSEFKVNAHPGVSIVLLPNSPSFEVEKVPQGVVGFTASIKNEGTTTIRIAHPSICFPSEYKQGEERRFSDSYGKAEILLKVTKPNGTRVVLRDGHLYCFDPGNVPILTISPNGTGTFYVGWFFQNARGRWERDDEAAKVFLLKGRYKISILFRNVFHQAALYDEDAKRIKFVDVWTGEMESREITIEVK